MEKVEKTFWKHGILTELYVFAAFRTTADRIEIVIVEATERPE